MVKAAVQVAARGVGEAGRAALLLPGQMAIASVQNAAKR